MDIIVKKKDIVANKSPYVSINTTNSKTYILFLLNDDNDIVHICRTIDFHEKLKEKKTKILFTHYSVEEIDTDIANDYLAELIIKFNPFGNTSVPSNNKFLSHHQAKEKYRINKTEFKKIWKEHGDKLMFEDRYYIEAKIIQDALGQFEEYHKDMPKVNGKYIILKKNILSYESFGGLELQTLYNEDEEPVEAYADAEIDWQEIHDRYMHNQNHALNVTEVIDTVNFIAEDKDGKTYSLNANDKDSTWCFIFNYLDLSHIENMLKEQNSDASN